MEKVKLVADTKKLKNELYKKKLVVEIGVFSNKMARYPNTNIKKPFLSGIVNTAGKQSKTPIASVLKALEKSIGILNNFFKTSTQQDKIKEIIISYFFNPKQNITKIQNAITSFVILPVTKKQIGNNSVKTIANKGFNWKGVNTSQTIKNIKTKVYYNDK